ncbi:hypothetical protein RMN57_28850 [Kitasatospora sp. CM 4170]|uniref:Uncharacterized protein n=1 Tax=Kitasatospora aburaviensis TaxID=67265 RepID=A0ABW1EP62_9ACTN|nr:hypothetical protein [Kitasatospora sp. CM 4170]WNM48404.1 hypothetical protein RMN57_28850 [Kitasatospora sp. CM 4170]
MSEINTAVAGVGWYQRIRDCDFVVATLVGVGNLLLGGMLFMMCLSSSITFGGPTAADTARMHDTSRLAQSVFFGWLLVGLLLFGVFRMTRSVITHLACMIVPLIGLVVVSAASR